MVLERDMIPAIPYFIFLTEYIAHLIKKLQNILWAYSFKKAFDTVDHQILFKKLEFYGFRNVANIWFKNYLTGRSQYVSINGVDSACKTMMCGVPQGSVLGPLLFLIFINDLPSSIDFFTLLFADDTTLQLSGSNLSDLYAKANIELSKAQKWFEANRLTLNVKKTKYILFRTTSMTVEFANFSLQLDGKNVDRIGHKCKETSFKFVGHHLDEFLTWDAHIKHVISKLGSANYAIGRTKNFLPLKIRFTIHCSKATLNLDFYLLVVPKCLNLKK